jgi:hypothetical protein
MQRILYRSGLIKPDTNLGDKITTRRDVQWQVQAASKKWTMPIRNWKLALNRFMIEFEDRLVEYV